MWMPNSESSVFRNVGGLVGVLKAEEKTGLLIMISRQREPRKVVRCSHSR